MKAILADVFQALNDEGGCVQFRHRDYCVFVVYGDGRRKSLDGRSYQGFLKTMGTPFSELKQVVSMRIPLLSSGVDPKKTLDMLRTIGV